jgi:hypothetical protein
MNSNRIKVTLYNRTFKEIDQSDFTRITEGLFSNRDDIVEVAFPDGVETIGFKIADDLRRWSFQSLLSQLKAKRLLIVQVLKKQIMVVM